MTTADLRWNAFLAAQAALEKADAVYQDAREAYQAAQDAVHVAERKETEAWQDYCLVAFGKGGNVR